MNEKVWIEKKTLLPQSKLSQIQSETSVQSLLLLNDHDDSLEHRPEDQSFAPDDPFNFKINLQHFQHVKINFAFLEKVTKLT